MLEVFIVDDLVPHVNIIKDHVEYWIAEKLYDMNIVMATGDPVEVAEYVKRSNGTGLYFLDVDLNHEIDGLKLAGIIKDFDINGIFVIITTHFAAMDWSFKVHTGAIGFIFKDDFRTVKEQIGDNMAVAYSIYSKRTSYNQFIFDYDGVTHFIEYRKIITFTTSITNKGHIEVNTLGGTFEYLDTMTNLLNKLERLSAFFPCGKSCIINFMQVEAIDYNKRIIYFKNGTTFSIPRRSIPGIKKKMEYNHSIKIIKKKK